RVKSDVQRTRIGRQRLHVGGRKTGQPEQVVGVNGAQRRTEVFVCPVRIAVCFRLERGEQVLQYDPQRRLRVVGQRRVLQMRIEHDLVEKEIDLRVDRAGDGRMADRHVDAADAVDAL